MRSFVKRCTGCCSMKKAGEYFYVCMFIQCPFHPVNIGLSDQLQNVNVPTIDISCG